MNLATFLPLLLAGPIAMAMLVAMLPSLLWRRIVSMASVLALGGYALALLMATSNGAVVATTVGGWPVGLGIAFAVDTFSALLLVMLAVVVTASLAMVAATDGDTRRSFLPMVLVLAAGVAGAFATADLFNLFVCIEVALVPSYVLLTSRASSSELSAGRVYIAVNLLASTVYLIGVGFIYGVAGTVNLGELGLLVRSPEAMAQLSALPWAALVVVVALVVKAALVPAHAWLPRSYVYAPAVVTALFAGLLTKIGIYALFRIYTVLFAPLPTQWDWVWLLLMVVALASMLLGVFSALGETTMRGILTFHMVSQAGYIVAGLAMVTVVGVAAGIFYLVTYSVVKTALLLNTAAVKSLTGTDRLADLGGLVQQHKLLAVTFLGGALSLIGIPPFVGFIAKFDLVTAGIATSTALSYVSVAVMLLVSVFTLLSMMKIYNAVYWGEPSVTALAVEVERGRYFALVLPGTVLVGLALLVGIFPENLLALAEVASNGLLDPVAYLSAIAEVQR